MKKFLAILMAALMLALPAAAEEVSEPTVTSTEEIAEAVEVKEETIFKLYVLDAADNTIIGYIDETSPFQLVSASLYGVEAVALVADELAEGYSISYNDAALDLGVITAPIPVEAFTSINWTLSYAIGENLSMQYSNFIWLFGHPDNYVDVTAYITTADGEVLTETVLSNEVLEAVKDGDVINTKLEEIPEDAAVSFYVNADPDIQVSINGEAAEGGYTASVAAADVEDFEIAVTEGEETVTFTYTIAPEKESIHPITKHLFYGIVNKVLTKLPTP